jgi:hypothetical protein
MQFVLAMGMGFSACSPLHNSCAMNVCGLVCLIGGMLLIGAAVWHVRKAPGSVSALISADFEKR